jgi:hypothetical protein
MTWPALVSYAVVAGLAFAQSVTFSLASRARNRDSFAYHLLAATLSNTVWFLTFRSLLERDMSFALLITYTLGSVPGSIIGGKLGMAIEKFLDARSDGHLKE